MKKNKKNIPLPIEDDKPMNDKQMRDCLVDLYQSYNWKAIKRFIDIEIIKVENTLCTIDLLKEQTVAIRSQGIRAGLLSLVNFIELEIENRKKAENNGEEEKNTPHYNY